jgi:enterochelin esterase-like enzyme
MTVETWVSPYLEALRRDLAAGQTSVVPAFWQAVAARGTPLIEPLAGDAMHSLVTFLWRGGDEIQNVVVMDGVAQGGSASNQLRRLENTNVWHKTYRVRNDILTAYIFSLNDPLTPWTAEAWVEHQAAGRAQSDPLNPEKVFDTDNIFVAESVLRMPDARPEPWIVAQPGLPAGQTVERRFASAILGNTRRVRIYTPPGYRGDSTYGWMLLLDGDAYYGVRVTTILDNLLAQGRIPPLIAVFFDNASHADRHLEMSCNPRLVEALAGELLPSLREVYHLADDPARAIIAGSSYTGLAAAYAAYRRPGLWGNVLAQSGAFSWYQGQDRKPEAGEDTEPGWLIRQFVKADVLPLRFHLDVGRLETTSDYGGAAHTNILNSNRHMRDVLRAKGYPVNYVERSGGHDFAGWRSALPDALAWFGDSWRGR